MKANEKGFFLLKNMILALKSINFTSKRWEFMLFGRIWLIEGMQAGVTGGV